MLKSWFLLLFVYLPIDAWSPIKWTLASVVDVDPDKTLQNKAYAQAHYCLHKKTCFLFK